METKNWLAVGWMGSQNKSVGPGTNADGPVQDRRLLTMRQISSGCFCWTSHDSKAAAVVL